jgi:hypothetical protein
MENGSNGWLRLAGAASALIALIGALKTILRFLEDLGGNGLNWSLA